MGGFVESVMDVGGSVFEAVAGGAEDVAAPIVSAGSAIMGFADKNMEYIIPIIAAAITAGTINAGMSAAQIAATTGISEAAITPEVMAAATEVGSGVGTTAGGMTAAEAAEIAGTSAGAQAAGVVGGGGAVGGNSLANMVVPGLIGASTLASGIIGADAAKDAAEAQAQAATQAAKTASDTQLQMFEQGRADVAPWREAGGNALADLVARIKAGPGEFTTSPGYEFRVGEGQKAIERSAAARGSVLSPSTLKALTRFGQGTALDEYQNFLAQYYASLNPLQSLANVGQTTAMQTAGQGTQVGANVGQNIMTAGLTSGQAQAGGDINRANAITGGLNSGINNYLMWKYLNKPTDANTLSSFYTG